MASRIKRREVIMDYSSLVSRLKNEGSNLSIEAAEAIKNLVSENDRLSGKASTCKMPDSNDEFAKEYKRMTGSEVSFF
jgi:hypothetical protein